MTDRKRKLIFGLLTVLTATVLYIVQYNGVFSLKIGDANPMMTLGLCVCFSMFASELDSVLFGMIIGFITDGAASGTSAFFNTLTFMLISLAVSLIVRYLFNNNYRSAIVLGLICSTIYYLTRFIFCVPKGGLESGVSYLLSVSLPSVIYTAVFTFALYFLEKLIFSNYYKAR